MSHTKQLIDTVLEGSTELVNKDEFFYKIQDVKRGGGGGDP